MFVSCVFLVGGSAETCIGFDFVCSSAALDCFVPLKLSSYAYAEGLKEGSREVLLLLNKD